jgi:hypothetical protein
MNCTVNTLAIRRRSPFGLAGTVLARSTPISD